MSQRGSYTLGIAEYGDLVGAPMYLDISPPNDPGDDTPAKVNAALDEGDAAIVRLGQQPEIVLLSCRGDLTLIDPDLENDPDGTLRPVLWSTSLQKRVGSSVPCHILNIFDPTGDTVVFNSAEYENGNNGQILIDAGGDEHTYALANPRDCVDATIRDNQPVGGTVRLQAEHIIERITVPYFFEFVQQPALNLEDGAGMITAPGNFRVIDFDVIADFMDEPYETWPGWSPATYGTPYPGQSLMTDIAQALGSRENTAVMTNLAADLNNVKSRVWDTFVNVTVLSRWNRFAAARTTDNTADALELIRAVSPPKKLCLNEAAEADECSFCRVLLFSTISMMPQCRSC